MALAIITNQEANGRFILLTENQEEYSIEPNDSMYPIAEQLYESEAYFEFDTETQEIISPEVTDTELNLIHVDFEYPDDLN